MHTEASVTEHLPVPQPHLGKVEGIKTLKTIWQRKVRFTVQQMKQADCTLLGL